MTTPTLLPAVRIGWGNLSKHTEETEYKLPCLSADSRMLTVTFTRKAAICARWGLHISILLCRLKPPRKTFLRQHINLLCLPLELFWDPTKLSMERRHVMNGTRVQTRKWNAPCYDREPGASWPFPKWKVCLLPQNQDFFSTNHTLCFKLSCQMSHHCPPGHYTITFKGNVNCKTAVLFCTRMSKIKKNGHTKWWGECRTLLAGV